MRRWIVAFVALLVGVATMNAQPMSDSYYRENPSWIDAELWALEGEPFFITALSENPFEEYALYGFSFVDYSPRGERYPTQGVLLGSIDTRNPLQRYPDYSLLSLLRRAPTTQSYHLHTPNEIDTSPSSQLIAPSPFDLGPSSRLRLQLSSRTYRMGVGYAGVAHRGDSLAVSIAVGARGGRDANIEGIYSAESYLWLAGERRWNKEQAHRLQVALMVAPSERAQRSWNTEEVFALSGNRHYNSYWGYQEGRVRSARVRHTALPALYASWDIDDRYILSRLNLSAFVQAGRTSRTSLDWADVSNPQPDHYTYLPSHQSDPDAAALLAEVWRTNNTDFTQINFAKIYEAAALQPNRSPYLLSEERSDLFTAKIDLSGQLLGTHHRRLGVRGGYHRSHNYNVVADLFGAQSANPNAFTPYDYTPTQAEWSLYATLRERLWGGSFYGSVEFGGQTIAYRSRTTAYSAEHSFTLLRAQLAWSRPLTDNLSGGLNGYFNHSAPYWGDIYGSAEGTMSINHFGKGTTIGSGQMWGRWEGGSLVVFTSLYAEICGNLSHSENYWDAPSATYSTLLAGNLATLAAGVQLSVEARLTRSLKLEGHLGLSSNRYTGNGIGHIVSFDDAMPIIESTTLHLEGMRSSATPALASALRATWYAPGGWMVGSEAAFVAGRYLEPSLLLCSDYARSQWLTEEDYKSAVGTPHSLGNACNLSLFVYRRLGNVSFSASVRNLLNSTSAYSAGYQPSRINIHRSNTSFTTTPHAPRYQHIYPRHIYISIGYEF